MRTDWEQDELISAWTLVEGDWDLVGEKARAGRLGFALILKFYEIEGRFPAYPEEEIPAAAVEYVASLVAVEPGLLAKYSWRSPGPSSATGRPRRCHLLADLVPDQEALGRPLGPGRRRTRRERG